MFRKMVVVLCVSEGRGEGRSATPVVGRDPRHGLEGQPHALLQAAAATPSHNAIFHLRHGSA
jgi:hypothetical protein